MGELSIPKNTRNFMKQTKFERQLAEFEARANDDLTLLDELGAAHFSTSNLLELDFKIEEKLAAFDFYHKRVIWLGATAAGWLLLGVGSLFCGWRLAAQILFLLVPFSVAGFIGGSIFLKKNFESRGHWFNLRAELREELAKRKAILEGKRQK
jgi:hypothetical protein